MTSKVKRSVIVVQYKDEWHCKIVQLQIYWKTTNAWRLHYGPQLLGQGDQDESSSQLTEKSESSALRWSAMYWTPSMARCIAGEIVETSMSCSELVSLVDPAIIVSPRWSADGCFFFPPVVLVSPAPSSCRQQYWKLWERRRYPPRREASFRSSNMCSTLRERRYEAMVLDSSFVRWWSRPSGNVGGNDNWEENEAADLCPCRSCFSDRSEYCPDMDWQKELAFSDWLFSLQFARGEEGGEGELTWMLGLSVRAFGIVFCAWPICLNSVSSPVQKDCEFPGPDTVAGRCIISISFLQCCLAVPGGRFMKRTFGTKSKNTLLTQCGMPWVCGDRWCTFNTKTVIMMERVTKTIVNSKYSPISGITRDVDGMISVISRRNTVRDSSTEIHKVIFSPHCEGK